MKTMIKINAIICCFLLQIQVFGQTDPPDRQNPVTLKSGSGTLEHKPVGAVNNSGTGMYEQKYSLGKEGSLFFSDWSPGTVVLADKTVITDRMLRYDIFHRQMQFAVNGDTAAFGKPEEVNSITFEKNTFVYDEFLCKDGKRKDYLEVLVDGDCRLLLYRCIAYKYVGECAMPGAENPKEEYYQTKKYFISKDKNLAIPLPENKNDVIELLSDKNKDIKSFMKDNDIKLTREEDLIRLINNYNKD
jgi:hypothetical protein